MTLTLRAITADDLPLLVEWFIRPHVWRWWHHTPDLEQTRATYLPRIAGSEPTTMIMVLEDDAPIGLAQHYAWDDYSEDRDNYRIGPGELGMDYPLGTPVSVTLEATNQPSRRVLETNGFTLVDIRQSQQLDGRAPEGPTARYRRLL